VTSRRSLGRNLRIDGRIGIRKRRKEWRGIYQLSAVVEQRLINDNGSCTALCVSNFN
jgi:hypothetical protein